MMRSFVKNEGTMPYIDEGQQYKPPCRYKNKVGAIEPNPNIDGKTTDVACDLDS